MNASSRIDFNFSPSLIRAYISLALSRPFFNLLPFPFSFYLTPLLPSYAVLSDFSHFLLAISQPRRIPVLFYFRRLHFSFSFDAYAALCPFRVVRAVAVASFIVFVPRCPPPCCRVAGAATPIPLQVFYARKRAAFSYFSRLPFSRVRPAAFVARERSRDPPPRRAAPRHPLRDIFRFPFRYVRSVRYVIRSTLS